jgi:LysR family transcriptional activator of nhaA
MSLDYNYRHLYYFWVVAQEGGMSRGAQRLGVAVQTVSAQVRELERALGHALLQPSGRGLTLTEAGWAAMREADRIFALGQALPERVREAAQALRTQRLAVGASGGLPKLLVWRLLQPVLAEPRLRLHIREHPIDDLLADLALHRLDLVLTDRPPPTHPGLRLHSQRLGAFPVAWYAAPAWRAARDGFPQSLGQVPVLLPTLPSAMRLGLDLWFEREGVRPRVAGEFDDSALLKTFGSSGLGVFPATESMHADLVGRYGVERLGTCHGVEEPVYVVAVDRPVPHPLVERLLGQAVQQLQAPVEPVSPAPAAP